jgi:2-polyprenyl-3-methyl-5-hydroxy-6-metoxy-1,4-benzoquinol methylase
MIIHRLILQYLAHRDDPAFYEFQAEDAVRWLERWNVTLGSGVRALDLGCGHGIFGAVLAKRGCEVVYADESNTLMPELAAARFIKFNIDTDDLAGLGSYNLVICSNVYEHLAKPGRFLENVARILRPGGKLYLSWTNWLSAWGGHEFSPFHYLGPRRGHLVYDRLVKRRRKHTPYVNLFPTYVGETMGKVRGLPDLNLLRAAPRYYPEFAFLLRLPVLREFLAWNCALLIGRVDATKGRQ